MNKRDEFRRRRSFLAGAGSLTAVAAATGALPAKAQDRGPIKIRVGYQFGLVYAPILLMKELDLLKRYSPNVSAEYSRVASGSVIRDQVIAKQLDIGVLGPPPFMTGWQHLNWKYLVGTGIFPYQLVTWRPDIKTLKDFKPEDKIAVPGPSSLQSILLAMGAKKYLGDAKALAKNVISLPHPDAAAAVLSKNPTVAAHFANIPLLFKELDAGYIHVVLDGFDAFGGKFMSPLAFAAPDFAERNPQGMALFIAAYNDAVAMINVEPATAFLAYVGGPENQAKVRVKALVTDRVGKGVAWMPFHFSGFYQGADLRARYPQGTDPVVLGESVNTVTTYGFDPVTGMQEPKATLCQIRAA